MTDSPKRSDIQNKAATDLRIADLDGKSGISEKEGLVRDYAIDQWQMETESLSQSELAQAVQDSKAWYLTVASRTPKPQTIFVDFSAFQTLYAQNLQTATRKDFAAFKKEILGRSAAYFSNESGKPLAITFTDQRPKTGAFTTVAITPEDYKTFMLGSDDRKRTLVLNLLMREPRAKTDIERIKAEIQKRNPNISKRDLLLGVANNTDFQKNLPTGSAGHTVLTTENEFGNPNPTDLIWVSATKLVRDYTEAKAVLESNGRRQVISYAQPFIAQDPTQNIAITLSDTIAHEVGHALGLLHPAARLRETRKQGTAPASTPSLMNQPQEMVAARKKPGEPQFSPFARRYLTTVLGENTQRKK